VPAGNATFANSREQLRFSPMLQESNLNEPWQPSADLNSEWVEEGDRTALLALFRLLVREPPRDHDFRTCPICKRYGLTKI